MAGVLFFVIVVVVILLLLGQKNKHVEKSL